MVLSPIECDARVNATESADDVSEWHEHKLVRSQQLANSHRITNVVRCTCIKLMKDAHVVAYHLRYLRASQTQAQQRQTQAAGTPQSATGTHSESQVTWAMRCIRGSE